MEFLTEPLARVRQDAIPLTRAHWDEVETSLHGPEAQPFDAEQYARWEALDMLHISTVRRDGHLAGYAAFTLCPCPHRPGRLLAALDGLYLVPEARGGLTALRLLRHAEDALRQRGVTVLQFSSPASRPCDALYRRLDARHTESVWHKEVR